MTPTEIRALRRSLGLTQSQLGRLLGLNGVRPSDSVQAWEAGIHSKWARIPSAPVMNLMILLQAYSQGTDALYRAFGDLWAKAGIARD